MAYTPGFEYDIFISYAHVDDAPLTGQEAGWVKLFYENLKTILARRFGRADMVKIWFDNRKLDGSVLFDQSIADGIKKSAIMICLNSMGYKESDYCQQELDTFYKKVQTETTGLKIGDQTRILNVLLNNIPFKEWPTELSGTSGFHFYKKKDEDDYGKTIMPKSDEFLDYVESLRDPIYKLLTNFPKTPGTVEPTPEEDKDEFTIYFGEVSDSLRPSRKRIINELEKKGFKTLAGIPPPYESDAHEKKTKEALTKAHLAIHLLDKIPGREIDDAPGTWYSQKQAELTLQSDQAKMIWLPRDVDFEAIDDESYKDFLQNLTTGKTTSKGLDFVRGYEGELPQLILAEAEKLKSQYLQKKAEKGKLSVLIDIHANDQVFADDLITTLYENQIQPFITPLENGPRKNIDILGDRLSQVSKLIFLYGNGSNEWVQERINTTFQLILNNNYPIEDCYVFMAPPHKLASDIAIRQKFIKLNFIDSSNYQGLDQDVLQQFLTLLKTNAA